MENNKHIPEEKVGYKNPPKSGRFKKGQSGNPAGRKKRIVPKSILDALILCANEIITIKNEKGVSQKLSMFEILSKKLMQDACQKDGPARKFIIEHFLKADLDALYKNIVRKSESEAAKTVDNTQSGNFLKQLIEGLYRQEQEEDNEDN